LTAFSQSVTNNTIKTDTAVVVLPYRVARLVAIDLVRYDSTKAELQATQQLLRFTNDKITKQDSLIKTYDSQMITMNNQIKAYEQKDTIQTQMVSDLQKDNRKQGRIIKVLGTTAGIFFVTTLTLFLAH
jgi:hypothetical protein